MDKITPAYLQPGKPVQVSGMITNLDRVAWGDVQVYLLAPLDPAADVRPVVGDLVKTPRRLGLRHRRLQGVEQVRAEREGDA